MKNILKSMKDFVLEQKREMQEREEYEFMFGIAGRCFEYAEFLEQPLKLGMFVPTDEEGNPMKSPWCNLGKNCEDLMCTKYKEVEQKVIFDGKFDIYPLDNLKNQYRIFKDNVCIWTTIDSNAKIIEDLIPHNLTVKY